MSQFRCHGIGEALAAQVRSSMRSPQYGHPAHRELAPGYGEAGCFMAAVRTSNR
jgi:hypothetical protein